MAGCGSHQHIRSLKNVLAPLAQVHYIVGNSKFYDVVLPTEQLYAAIFESEGFHDVQIETIRKRTSKKELFEYVVSARFQGGDKPTPLPYTSHEPASL